MNIDMRNIKPELEERFKRLGEIYGTTVSSKLIEIVFKEHEFLIKKLTHAREDKESFRTANIEMKEKLYNVTKAIETLKNFT